MRPNRRRVVADLLESAGAEPTLRGLLRARTRAAHQRTEAAFDAFDLRQRPDYERFLRAHAAVLPAVEAAAEDAGAGDLLPDWDKRRRSPALAADMARLEVPAPESAPEFALDSRASALGALYVLEGSRLGSTILLARVRHSGDAGALSAVGYLAHGRGRRFWPAFLAALERFHGERRVVVEGALATFTAFEAAALRQAALANTLSSAADRSWTAKGF